MACPDPAPAVLLPYQQRWIRDPSPVKVYEKSRRIGATWATAAACILEASSGTHDVWYVSYNEDGAKEFILDCVAWAKKLNLYATHVGQVILRENEDAKLEGVRGFQIVFPSGKRITSLTSAARNLRGKAGIVIIDEAAFHDDLPELLKAAFALLMWGGQVWVMSTHNGVDNAFNELVDDIRDGKKSYSLHRTTIEDALSEGLYRRICAILNQPYSLPLERSWLADLERQYGDGAREELYCEPAGGGTSYIGRMLIELRMIDAPVIRLEKPDSWAINASPSERSNEIALWCQTELSPLCDKLSKHQPHAFGFDFGRYSDRSVLAPMTLEQNLVRRCPFLVELSNIPHNQQWQILQYVGARLPNLFKAHLDGTGNGSWVAEQALEYWGPQTIEVQTITKKWYAENMPPFREAHERGTIAYPRDLDVRNDVAMIRRVAGVPLLPHERSESTSGKKRHGDAAIALVLALAATREAESHYNRWNHLTA